jgi:hypothetical protein
MSRPTRNNPRPRSLTATPIKAAVAVALLAVVIAGCATDASDRLDGDGTDAASSASALPPSAFATRVEHFLPGIGAGFGADKMPSVVLGPPRGGGANAGSLDVVSLGDGGEIVLAFEEGALYDGPGADFIVFENPFSTWLERGEVSVSDDGVVWTTFACAKDDAAGGFPGCAGVHPVFSHPDNGIAANDPAVAGGDAFDLADVGVARARFVRVVDSGGNSYDGTTGGFDLDAIVATHANIP